MNHHKLCSRITDQTSFGEAPALSQGSGQPLPPQDDRRPFHGYSGVPEEAGVP